MLPTYFLAGLQREADAFFFSYYAIFTTYFMCTVMSIMLAFAMANHNHTMVLFGLTMDFWWTFNGLFIGCK
jgi:hypothetical protein